MPHLRYSHKSEDVLLNRSLAIDAAKVATRTSSVRVKAGSRSSRSYTERFKAKAGHRYRSNGEALPSADRGSNMGTPSRSQSRARKLPALFSDFSIHKREHQQKPRARSSSLKMPPEGYTKGNTTTHTFEPAQLSDGVEKLPGTLPAAKTVHHLQERSERTESSVTDAGDEVWYECDQSISQGEEEESKAKGEYRVRVWWQMIRLALQVDLDSSSKCLPVPGAQSCSRSWRHPDSNFFPPRFSHLEQNQVIEALLDERRRSQQPNGESLLFRSPTWGQCSSSTSPQQRHLSYSLPNAQNKTEENTTSQELTREMAQTWLHYC